MTQACNQALLAATKRKEVLQIQEQPGSYQVLPDVEEIMWVSAQGVRMGCIEGVQGCREASDMGECTTG